MKAYNLHGVDDLRYEEVEVPALEPGWTLIKVKAAGICSSDIPRIFTKGTYHFPTIPGHEFSGIVEAVAEGDAENQKLVGKHVGIFPLIPCRECQPCKDHHYEMCEHYDYVGSRRDGGFAEYVAVPAWNLIELPESIPFEEAAMLEPLSVALHAVKRAGVKEGYTVGIIGTGMIGFAAAQWAKMLGAAQVTVIGRSADKQELADRVGVDYVIAGGADSGNAAGSAVEYDCVIEAVGSPACVEQAIRATKAGGSLVLMGNPSGDIALKQDVYWRILRKQIRVTGTWNSSYENGEECDWTQAVDALGNQKVCVKPLITHCFSQEELGDGLQVMKNHQETYCKVMTTWNQE